MAEKPYGYCHRYRCIINHDKFISKCRHALGGKVCSQFDRKIPKRAPQRKGKYQDKESRPRL